jgi:polyferredoxin
VIEMPNWFFWPLLLFFMAASWLTSPGAEYFGMVPEFLGSFQDRFNLVGGFAVCLIGAQIIIAMALFIWRGCK